MTTTRKPKRNTWQKLAIACATACLASCANHPKLVYRDLSTKLDFPAKPPANFVVSLDEARSAIPATKYCWSIYADRTNYYLLPDPVSPLVKTSHVIRRDGYTLSGVTRHDIDRINALREKNRAANRRPQLFPGQLKQALPNKSGKSR